MGCVCTYVQYVGHAVRAVGLLSLAYHPKVQVFSPYARIGYAGHAYSRTQRLLA